MRGQELGGSALEADGFVVNNKISLFYTEYNNLVVTIVEFFT